jgi:hypothetical protein
MCLNPYPNGTKPRIQHESLESAQIEAARLCRVMGKKIHVLKLVGTMHPPVEPEVFWEERP